MEDENNLITRVNGGMLANHLSQQVLIVAELVKLEDMRMKVKCSDGSIILANLQEAITQNLAPGSKLQILATPRSRNVVQCNDFIVLQDREDDFDMELYNNTIKLCAETINDNTFLIKDKEQHWGADNEKEVQIVDIPFGDSTNKQNNDTSVQMDRDQDQSYI